MVKYVYSLYVELCRFSIPAVAGFRLCGIKFGFTGKIVGVIPRRMISMENLITVIEIAGVFLILWVAMSIYKDARNRNMWALLWAYVAMLLPVVGWLLYFLFRSPMPKKQCPDCFERTARRDIFCYRCSYNFVNIASERKVLKKQEIRKKK